MSAKKDILNYFREIKENKNIKYKSLRTSFLGLPNFQYYKYQTLANKFSWLKTSGYLAEKNGEFFITKKGLDFLNKKNSHIFSKFETDKTEKDPKDLLVLYDIPQSQTSKRNWFRKELRKFHFIMIQKSVWVGPSPLPKEFLSYVNEIKIGDKFKTFKLAKGFILK